MFSKKKLLLLALLFLFIQAAATHALAQDKSDLWPYAVEEGAYHARHVETGEILWDVVWKTVVREEPDRTWVEILEKGVGQPWGYKQPVEWEKQMVIQTAPSLRVESLRGKRWTKEGKLLNELEARVDLQRKLLPYRDTGKKKGWTDLPWAPDHFPDEFLFHWARTFSFDQEPAGQFTLIVSPKRQFRMRVHTKGQELVETPAGFFLCHRLEFSYEGMLMKIFAPKLTLWCTVKPPHFWVRYLGPIGGPGSPKAIIELVRFRQGETSLKD